MQNSRADRKLYIGNLPKNITPMTVNYPYFKILNPFLVSKYFKLSFKENGS